MIGSCLDRTASQEEEKFARLDARCCCLSPSLTRIELLVRSTRLARKYQRCRLRPFQTGTSISPLSWTGKQVCAARRSLIALLVNRLLETCNTTAEEGAPARRSRHLPNQLLSAPAPSAAPVSRTS